MKKYINIGLISILAAMSISCNSIITDAKQPQDKKYGAVTGVIKYESGQSIKDPRLKIGDKEVLPDSNGFYLLQDIPSGEQTLIVYINDKVIYTKVIVVNESNVSNLNLSLQDPVVPSNPVISTPIQVVPSLVPSSVSTTQPVNNTSDSMNLIPNYELKTKDEIKDYPAQWDTDTWGTLNASFGWERSIVGSEYLSVNVTSYAEGDAKWVYEPQVLNQGWYEYSDEYRSDGRTRYILLNEDINTGVRKFDMLWQSDVSPSWKKESTRFYVSPSVSNRCSVMHVLDRAGWLNTRQHKLSPVNTPQSFIKPVISITFDDIWASAATQGAAELTKRGMKGSFYVVKAFAENPQGKYADKTMISTLIKSGHEIGSHSSDHSYLATLKASDISKRIEDNVIFLSSLGAKVNGIAYPFGDFDDAVELETMKYHKYSRTSLEGLNESKVNPYKLRIFPVTTSTPTQKILDLIDDASRTSTWLIFLFHDLGEYDVKNTYRTSMTQFITMLDYLKTKNIDVKTVEDTIEKYNLALK